MFEYKLITIGRIECADCVFSHDNCYTHLVHLIPGEYCGYVRIQTLRTDYQKTEAWVCSNTN